MDVDVHVILYTATHKAAEYINQQLMKYKEEKEIKGVIDIQIMQIINPYLMNESDKEFILLKNDYERHQNDENKSYVDKHFKKGDCNYPFLGFDGCSLPLVIYHNTPNNSFPTLWHSWSESTALFPRITRHKEV